MQWCSAGSQCQQAMASRFPLFCTLPMPAPQFKRHAACLPARPPACPPACLTPWPACLQLVIFHGCSHNTSDGWPYDPLGCSECVGLPEEVAHTKQALRMGYAVLAVESRSRDRSGPLGGRCFSSSLDAKKSDLPIVPYVIQVSRPLAALHVLRHRRLCHPQACCI
jgi:hypothetical protein